MTENSKQAKGLHEFNPLNHKVQLEYMRLDYEGRRKSERAIYKEDFWGQLEGYSKIGLYVNASNILKSNLKNLNEKLENLEDINEFVLEDNPLLFIENLVNYSIFYANYLEVYGENIKNYYDYDYNEFIERCFRTFNLLSEKFLVECRNNDFPQDTEKLLVNLYEGVFILDIRLNELYQDEPQQSEKIKQMEELFGSRFDDDKIQEITKYATEKGCENFLKALNDYISNK